MFYWFTMIIEHMVCMEWVYFSCDHNRYIFIPCFIIASKLDFSENEYILYMYLIYVSQMFILYMYLLYAPQLYFLAIFTWKKVLSYKIAFLPINEYICTLYLHLMYLVKGILFQIDLSTYNKKKERVGMSLGWEW